jgi:hypothetical protein
VNLAAIRNDVSTALNAVAGITATPYYRQISRQGEAVVRFDKAIRDVTGFGWIVSVQALIALPQGITDAEVWVDGNVDALVDALGPELVVGEVAPVQLQLDTGLVPALQITGTRAA